MGEQRLRQVRHQYRILDHSRHAMGYPKRSTHAHASKVGEHLVGQINNQIITVYIHTRTSAGVVMQTRTTPTASGCPSRIQSPTENRHRRSA